MYDLTIASGMPLELDEEQLFLQFGQGMLAPRPERRKVDDVRSMLEDPHAQGPDPLYTVYMGIGREEERGRIDAQGLIYGSVLYNTGTIGQERLRGQGHIHSLKAGTPYRYSEVFEFWTGSGWVYLQRESAPVVTRAFLVPFEPGDHLVVPFGWVHIVISDGREVVTFGAWAARDNTLEYTDLHALGGPAHFVRADGSVVVNPRYTSVPEVTYLPLSALPDLAIPHDYPIYTSWQERPELFDFIANPEQLGDVWSQM